MHLLNAFYPFPSFASIVLAIILTITLISRIYSNEKAKNWTQTKAIVTYVGTNAKTATIEYEYIFNNTKYIGKNFSYLGHPGKHTLVENQSIDIYINKENPKESVAKISKVTFSYLSGSLLFIFFFRFFMPISLHFINKNKHQKKYTPEPSI